MTQVMVYEHRAAAERPKFVAKISGEPRQLHPFMNTLRASMSLDAAERS